MKIKVLISGAGGDVAQGVMKALLSSSLDVELYATCIHPHSAWLHAPGVTGFVAPPSSETGYVDYLIRLISQNGIHAYIPTVDSEILKISMDKSRIESESGAQVFVDDVEKVKICDDKWRTVAFLKENGFAYPETVLADSPKVEEFIAKKGFPLVLKERSGKGSQNVHVIQNRDDLSRYPMGGDFILQEWLDPACGEYTSGVYLGDDGEVKGVCTFLRQLKNGSTFIAERIINADLESALEKMARKLGMKYLNIQSMRREDVLVPFEFNGRLSGSTAMVAKVFNAPEMFLRERFLKEKIQRVENPSRFIAMRYYEEIYSTQEQTDSMLSRSKEI